MTRLFYLAEKCVNITFSCVFLIQPVYRYLYSEALCFLLHADRVRSVVLENIRTLVLFVLTLPSKVTDSNSRTHSHTDGGGCHVRAAPQEQAGLQVLAQRHFHIKPVG